MTTAGGLGYTSDPCELIPGRPASVRADADLLRSRARQLEDAADSVAAIRIPGWEGAAADGFSDALGARPTGWRTTADALETAAAALLTYADTLTVAQGHAADAIDLWTRGEHLTATAERTHSLTVDAYARATSRSLASTQPPAFVDTGAPLRAEATAVLQDARTLVARAGEQARGKLAGIVISDTAIVRTESGTQGRTDSWQTTGAALSIDPTTGELTWGLGTAEAQSLVWSGAAAVTARNGNQYATAQAGTELGLKADAQFGVEDGQFLAEASAGFGAFANASAEIGNEHASLGVDARAMAGGYAEAGVGIGKEGIDARASAFLGAKLEAGTSMDFNGLGVEVTGEGWAGGGAEAGFTAGRNDDGSWTARGNSGAALGVGGSASAAITVPADEVEENAETAWFLLLIAGSGVTM